MSESLRVSAGSLPAVNDWFTIMNAYRLMSAYAEDNQCVCGCGHLFTSEDAPIFTMQFVTIPGEDTKELRIHWFHTETCQKRFLKT